MALQSRSARRSSCAPLAVLALLCATALFSQCAWAFTNVEDVPFTEVDEATQKTVVVTITGKKWEAVKSDLYNRVFFVELESQNTTWNDPRTEPLTDEEKAALPAEVVAAHEEALKGALNQDTTIANLTSAELQKLAKSGSMPTVVMVAVVPLVLFTAAVAWRIWYLQTYYPGLLFPTKERKQRFRNNSKFKPQKARGKMSQDGKGGRSANS